MLPDEAFQSYFLDVFGRPQRLSACECERVSEANLAQALHLLNSDEVQNKLAAGNGRADLLAKDPRPHPCWRNASFRNYADHMRTPEFRRGVRRLLALARRGRVAVMCAEAVPWRCHRSLIADWLVVEEEKPVEDVVGTARRPHRLTACARRVHGHLSYQLPRAMHDGLALERGHHDDG